MLKGAIHPFTYRGEGILATFVKKISPATLAGDISKSALFIC